MPILVVGAGPSGLMAALTAARKGRPVVLLERNRQTGRKLAITGKGRCNLANQAGVAEAVDQFSGNGRFLHSAFARFSVEEIIRFFTEAGVPLITERGGRVFPASGKASDVAAALTRIAQARGVRIQTGARVVSLCIEEDAVAGVRTADGVFWPGPVVLATGGKSYPATGSDGTGYRLAAAAGHRVVTPLPSLVPLRVREAWVRDLEGVCLRNVRFRADGGRDGSADFFGEFHFVEPGIGGPIVLSASRLVVRALQTQKMVPARLDLKPALDEETLMARLERDWKQHAGAPFLSSLPDILPRAMVPLVPGHTGIDGTTPCAQLTRSQRRDLVRYLKGIPLHVTGHGGFPRALVTQGGVDLREVDPRTMASRMVAGLFFCGEILDIDAQTGGYNIQAALSTGFCAGWHAAARETGNREERP